MPVESSVGNIYSYNGSVAQLQLGALINVNLVNFGSGEMTGTFNDDDGILSQSDDGTATISLDGGEAQAIDYIGTGWSATAFVLGVPVLPKEVMAFSVSGQIYLYFPNGLPLLSGVSIAFDIDPDADFTLRDQVMICFASGTRIQTRRGWRRVERLEPGDLVATADHGFQTLRWVGRRDVSARWMAADPRLWPVLIARGALGRGLPRRDLALTQQHRVLLVIEGRQVLIAVKHLIGHPGVRLAGPSAQSYHHLLFDQHEIVLSEGCATESLFLGPMAVKSMGNAQQAELALLFPAAAPGGQMTETARPVLKRREAPRRPQMLQGAGAEIFVPATALPAAPPAAGRNQAA